MDAIEHLEERKWETPDSYGGFSPVGDYVIASKHRDSKLLDQSNFDVALGCLEKVAEVFGDPADVPRDHIYYGACGEGNDATWVYTFSANHWGCGWVEYLMVRADAPEPILQEAGEIVCSLADYPVLDDEDLSNREHDEVMADWKREPLHSRLHYWKESQQHLHEFWKRSSVMIIRHDDAPSRDDDLFDYLRSRL